MQFRFRRGPPAGGGSNTYPKRSRSSRLSPQRSTVKLTLAIAVVALVLVAGTTTICLSGALTDCMTEYGGAHATIDSLFNPHLTACR
jgi:hypothetical protein